MKIGIIGYGNLAWHWVRILSKNESDQVFVYIRNPRKREELEKVIWLETLKEIALQCDVIVLAVKDSSIREVSEKIAPFIKEDTLVIHNSGTTPLDYLQGIHHRAVLWPMMTIKKKIEIDWQSCPLFLQYSEEQDRDRVYQFAQKISENIYEFDGEERELFHLAAVWANNFVNHMISKAYNLLEEKDLDPSILLPMIKTHLKYLEIKGDPSKLQTGPAQRKDKSTMKRHQKLMSEEDRELYRIISESIIQSS